MLPVAPGNLLGRVGRVLQDVVGPIGRSVDDRLHLAADVDQRLTEAVELVAGLALGRLDHERSRDRERDGRRMEAVVHQPLGQVLLRDAGGRAERPEVEDELVRDAAVRVGVEHLEVGLEQRLHVVRVQDRDTARLGDAAAAQQADVRMRDQHDARAAPRRGGDGRNGLPAADGNDGDVPAGTAPGGPRPRWGPCPGRRRRAGMANVLCRLRWQTSAPMAAGLVSPTCAFMFAPSM